jgi:hypothetical protein
VSTKFDLNKIGFEFYLGSVFVSGFYIQSRNNGLSVDAVLERTPWDTGIKWSDTADYTPTFRTETPSCPTTQWRTIVEYPARVPSWRWLQTGASGLLSTVQRVNWFLLLIYTLFL